MHSAKVTWNKFLINLLVFSQSILQFQFLLYFQNYTAPDVSHAICAHNLWLNMVRLLFLPYANFRTLNLKKFDCAFELPAQCPSGRSFWIQSFIIRSIGHISNDAWDCVIATNNFLHVRDLTTFTSDFCGAVLKDFLCAKSSMIFISWLYRVELFHWIKQSLKKRVRQTESDSTNAGVVTNG